MSIPGGHGASEGTMRGGWIQSSPRGMKTMFSTKPVAVVAMLALMGLALGQEKPDEQRIAKLIEQLKDSDLQDSAFRELVNQEQATVLVLCERLYLGDGLLRPGEGYVVKSLDHRDRSGASVETEAPSRVRQSCTKRRRSP